VPLLKLLDSKNGSLQHNAAFALYGIADNEVMIGTSIGLVMLVAFAFILVGYLFSYLLMFSPTLVVVGFFHNVGLYKVKTII